MGKERHAFMNSKSEIDAEELRQLVNLRTQRLLARSATDSVAADGEYCIPILFSGR